MIWTLYEYNEIDPIILSTGEDEEISIKDVADAIVKAVGFEGDYQVRLAIGTGLMSSLIHPRRTDNTASPRQMPSFKDSPVVSSSPLSRRLCSRVSPGSWRTTSECSGCVIWVIADSQFRAYWG